MSDDAFYTPNRTPPPPRERQPGEEVWRLRHPDGRVQTCELRNDDRFNARWDLVLLEDGELLFSRRCYGERDARFAAESVRRDLARTGWT